jgi:hypothetical protein
MTPVATVLYEDSMRPGANGSYPLHDLVMRMVEDEINGETWQLRRSIEKNPRNGVNKVLADIRRTTLIAGSGALFVLVDRDRVAEHLGLERRAAEDMIVAAIRGLSDAPERLFPFFLDPNVEGLLRGIRECDPELLPGSMAEALRKDLNERDLVFNAVKKAVRGAVRDCVRQRQPGLDGLVRALAGLLSR